MDEGNTGNTIDNTRLQQVLLKLNGLYDAGKNIHSLFDKVSTIVKDLYAIPVRVDVYWNEELYIHESDSSVFCFAVIQFKTADESHGKLDFFSSEKVSEITTHTSDLNLNLLSMMLSGLVNAAISRRLIHENAERNKEIAGIQRSIRILEHVVNLDKSLSEICTILPESFQYPESTSVRINYGLKTFTSDNFVTTPWVIKESFRTDDGKAGSIEVFYTENFPSEDEGPFLKEERALLVNLANLITGNTAKNLFGKLQLKNKERVKELKAINSITKLISERKPVDETLLEICSILPRSWQYPKHTAVRIHFEGKTYTSKKYSETRWRQVEHFVTIDNNKGTVEVFYLKSFPRSYEGPFLKEERNLLINVAGLICSYLNNHKGREVYRKSVFNTGGPGNRLSRYRETASPGKNPLHQFFNRKAIDKYIYLDMMKYKVKEILFVATLYDAFMLESDDSFFERFLGEIYQYSLFSLPRITVVTGEEDALEMLGNAPFDIVILMVGIDEDSPLKLSRKIKDKRPEIPVFLLLNQHTNIEYFKNIVPSVPSVDKLFIWNGDAQIFFAIVKSTEDYANVADDTKVGLVRVILLVEDSPEYYSKYLPMLYSIVFGQVQKLLPEAEKNELDKISKMRSRPKILHARNFEDATHFFNTYKDFLLCVISDMEFDRNGKLDKSAGVRFIKYAKSHILNLPIILQSAEVSYEKVAEDLKVTFINKTSETLLRDLRRFLTHYLGFGDFVFRDKEGNPIATARSYSEFVELLAQVPDESFYLHAVENQFSIWLMARGEIKLAKTLNPVRIGEFATVKESKQFILQCLHDYEEDRKKGKILEFHAETEPDERNILSLANGSLGGKGRGLAFINALIQNFDFGELTSKINIRIPVTLIIGTDEFEGFLRRNRLMETAIHEDISYQELRRLFAKGKLSKNLREKLKMLVEKVNRPLAVRSSSLSEDSHNQPFSGVFDTYVLPDSSDKDAFAEQLALAVKLVFASVYSDMARTYFKAIHRKVEEESMAVVIQELVGNRYSNYFYPHISGVAQSYNYYPIGHMKPEEGYSMAAFGLGCYVVDGWPSFRFSPKYPDTSIYSPKDQLKGSQTKFFALDYTKNTVDFLEGGEDAALTMLDISEAERHDTLRHCVSVYNPDNDRLEPGLDIAGPRVIDFANILQYNYIPLAKTLDILLETIKESLGTPVEIEYAVDLKRTRNNLPSFYLLQVKPLVGQQLNFDVNFREYERDKMLLFSQSSLGNGAVNDVRDIIYVKNESFNKLKTKEMALEIEELNDQMLKQEEKYVLIGPGRWGSRDPFLGIPVVWSQISNARIIVETSLKSFPLDASMGSHFFHNVTSMKIGYFSITGQSPDDFINWEKLNLFKSVRETKYFRHIRLPKPLNILMNGKEKKSIIVYNQ
jgi:hypothetical protein